jgi:D-sedoheptulose 7-phosphate isomerase
VIALANAPEAHLPRPACTARSGTRDARLAKEGRVVTYHLLWELTHVLLENAGRVGAPDAAFAKLYPFLGAGAGDRDAVRTDLCASGVAKLKALADLREATVLPSARRCRTARARSMTRCAAERRSGRSETAAARPTPTGPPIASPGARSLANDPAVLTALANDVGFERVFARQIAAFAGPGDVALGISTSGSSENVVAGLAEAKRRWPHHDRARGRRRRTARALQ